MTSIMLLELNYHDDMSKHVKHYFTCEIFIVIECKASDKRPTQLSVDEIMM